jgi:hypothetical protein
MYNLFFLTMRSVQLLSIALLTWAAMGCQKAEKPMDSEKVFAALEATMKEQENAWNAGLLDAFMQPYWKSDSLAFVGKSGITYGWHATLDRYRKNYPTANEMGRLAFKNLEWKAIDQAHVYTIGQWTLYRATDTLSGHYSLLWEKQNEKWCIVADHSS